MNHFSNTTLRNTEWLTKKTFSSILSLCLVVAISTTIAGFSEPEAPATVETMPIVHIVTDIAGRKIEGTILSKDATSIQFSRAIDGKKFSLELSKLSTEDNAFIKRLEPAPVKKPRLLLISSDPKDIKKTLEKRFEVTLAPTELLAEQPSGDPQDYTTKYMHLKVDANSFDIIWFTKLTCTQFKTRNQIKEIVKSGKKILVIEKEWPLTFDEYIGKEKYKDHHYAAASKPFIKSENNLISFSPTGEKWSHAAGESLILETKPEIYDQVITETIRVFENLRKPGQK